LPDWRNWVQVFDRGRLWHMGKVNTNIMLRSLLLQAMFISFLFVGAGFGDVTLAANQVLLQFLMISAYTLDGFAFAAEAMVGQAMGARQRAVLRHAALIAGFWGAIGSLGLTLVFALFGGALIDLMTTSGEVQQEARAYLIYMIMAPIAGCAAFMLDGVFVGATRTADMRNMMAISFVLYCAAAFALVPTYGNHGLWIALLTSFVARGATMALRYPALERQADLT
jgi:MATE family multidrug resistance protein